MQCRQCAVENRPGRKFCSACGQPLPVACQHCGFANDAGDEFCGGCGQRLHELSKSPAPAAQVLAETDGAERRQLTVMFCDIVESTALSAELDIEEFRALVRNYQAACEQVISHFDGYIAQYLGDGLLVYFGHPRAHEDDAQRAVRAGLAIVAAIRRLNLDPATRPNRALSVRVGIHTGLVVMGEVGGRERHEKLALGEAPNLAAHLQNLAPPDGVVISAATHRIVRGFFVTRGPLPRQVKGLPEPVSVYEIVDESGVRTRLDVAMAAGLTPLVGREHEVGMLLDRWQEVQDGQGHAVLVSGDAGVGKSRLVQAVLDKVPADAYTALEFRCLPYYANTPLYPITEVLATVLGWRSDDSSAERLAKLEQFGAERGLSATESVPLLAALLSLPPSASALPAMSPERQKQRTLETLLSLVFALAADKPVVLIVDDLHWMDPSTLDLLSLLIEQATNARLFILMTARLHFQPSWPPHSHVTTLTLDRFGQRQTTLMVERVAGDKTLPREVVEQIVTKTDGVPLFIEELTKMVLESGLLQERSHSFELSAALPPLAIPSTLQDSLTARLDRLDTVKMVAQLSATIGRAFGYPLLHAVSGLDEETLQRELSRLVDAELLYQRGVPPDAAYTFKHALIQEAAYQSLLKSTRLQYHQRIARAMVERFAAEAEAHPEFVAKHYTEAGLPIEALQWWNRAGESAVQRAANTEAIAHFTQALQVVAKLPASPLHDQFELGLQVALGYALIPMRGWASPATAKAFTRAGELSRQADGAPQSFRALWGLGAFHFVRGDQRRARDVADQCLSLAVQTAAEDDLIEAHYLSGIVSCARADFLSGQTDLQESVRLYGAQRRPSHAIQYGQDPKASSWGWLAMALWALGRPDTALLRARDALEFAQGAGHPFALARGLAGLGFVHVYRREPQADDGPLAGALTLCAEQGFAYFGAVVSSFQGTNLALRGRPNEGIALMRDSIAMLRAIGSELLFSLIFGNLAHAHLTLQQTDEGLQAVADGLALIDKTQEHWGEAELHRVRGELLLLGTAHDAEQAQLCFNQALQTARRQNAKSYELRAAMSTARLWSRQGKRAEAAQLLGGIYGSFTEGLTTPDLADARQLLEALR